MNTKTIFSRTFGWTAALVMLAVAVPSVVSAQDRRDYDRDRDRVVRLDPGTQIPVRLNERIDVDRDDNRVYTGIVDRDVRTDGGRVAIPRGTPAEMIVRVSPDNDLVL